MERFDETRQVVSWNGKESLGHLQGQVIQLRFTLQQARLYSFRFGSAEDTPGMRHGGWKRWVRLCQDLCGRDARAPGWVFIP